MANNYRDDKDLEMLRYADNEMLKLLVEYLTVDKDGDARFTEELLSDEEFKNANEDYQKVWRLIAGELQYYGGDTFVNLFRRKGVYYREILSDVCKKINVKTNYKAETVNIEQALLAKVLEKAWSEMNDNQKETIRKQLKIDPSLASSAAIASMLAAIEIGGFISYQASMILARSVARSITGHGLKMISSAGIGRAGSLAIGPIGWAISGLLTIPAISGPAFRVTLPCVVQIAAIRQQMIAKDKSYF